MLTRRFRICLNWGAFIIPLVLCLWLIFGRHLFGSRPINLNKEMAPEKVVLVFLNAAEKGDLKTIQAAHDPIIWKEIAPIWDGKPSGRYSKMSASIEKLDEDTAVVLIQNVDKSDWDYITLKKTDEGWRITY